METLKELKAQPGDVVSCQGVEYKVGIRQKLISMKNNLCCGRYPYWDTAKIFKLVSRRVKCWGELSEEEKGQLLLAEYSGTQVWYGHFPTDGLIMKKQKTEKFKDSWFYGVKSFEKVTLYGTKCEASWEFGSNPDYENTYSITLDFLDGEPVTGVYTSKDGNEIKVEKRTQ